MILSTTPYWWDAIEPPESSPPELPSKADVVVIGAGFTGLTAALTLARGGRGVLVIDMRNPGAGASSRNLGYFGYELRTSLSVLIGRFGRETALQVAQVGWDAFAYAKDLIESEQIQCDFQEPGRLVCAYRPSHYEALGREAELVKRELGIEHKMLSREEMRDEIGTEAYFGAKLLPNSCAMHAGKYVRGLLERARSAGVNVVGNTRVTALNTTDKVVVTENGTVRAREVIVATNGYTGDFLPALKRRLIPIASAVIATEELDESVLRSVFPTKRVAIDTRKVFRAFRLSPDGKRILFGSRPRSLTDDGAANAAQLRDLLVDVFPQLSDVAVSHSWGGYTGFTFDHLPHLGQHDGVHYALGFNGAGATMGPYLGHHIARRILGGKRGECRLEEFEFKGRPLYTGNPWFLPLVLTGYRLKDWLAR